MIHETAVIKNTVHGDIKVFHNVVLRDCRLGKDCSIGDDTVIERTVLGSNIAINRRNYINDSEISDYSYTGLNTIINWTKIGKFCSIARNVDIGGVDHDYKKVTTMLDHRFYQLFNGGGKYSQMGERRELTVIGNDVWIAAGAQILNKVTIGDGAVIGAGAVVTHDVPPYAIVVGVPAKIIGYRCDQRYIDDLLKIKWWDWELELIANNLDVLIHSDINEETIEKLYSISRVGE